MTNRKSMVNKQKLSYFHHGEAGAHHLGSPLKLLWVHMVSLHEGRTLPMTMPLMVLVIPPVASVNALPVFTNSQQSSRVHLSAIAVCRPQKSGEMWSYQMTKSRHSHRTRNSKPGFSLKQGLTWILTKSASMILVHIQMSQATEMILGKYQLKRLTYLTQWDVDQMRKSGNFHSWTRWLWMMHR